MSESRWNFSFPTTISDCGVPEVGASYEDLWMVVGGWWWVDGGEWMVVGGEWLVVSGWW